MCLFVFLLLVYVCLCRSVSISMTTDMACWKTTTSTTTCTLVSRSGEEGSFLNCPCVNPLFVSRLKTLCCRMCFRTGSNPKIRRNKIWGGQNGGILVYNSGLVRSSPWTLQLESCSFFIGLKIHFGIILKSIILKITQFSLMELKDLVLSINLL